MDKRIKTIILIIIVLILIAINIYIFIIHNKTNKEVASENQIEENLTNEVSSSNLLEQKISTMSERSRMQTYIGQFILLLSKKDYDGAYAKLNPDFKTNYFPTVDKFKEYIIQKYPKTISINYTNIERQGQFFIVTLEISDSFSSDYTTITQRYVIEEKGNNNYLISFQVI